MSAAIITLVERLRDCASWDPGDVVDEGYALLREAADRIEALQNDLFTAYFMAAQDATDAPGRLSMALRPFLAGAVERHGLDSGSSTEVER